MKSFDRLLRFFIIAVTAMQLEGACESPIKKRRLNQDDVDLLASPSTTVELFSTLSPQSNQSQQYFDTQHEKSKLDICREKMSHISYRLDGDCLVSCLEPIDKASLGIVNQQVFDVVQSFHQFRIDINNLTTSEMASTDAWDMSRRVCNLIRIDENVQKLFHNEPYKTKIFQMIWDDFKSIKYDLALHGLLRGENLLNKNLNKRTKKLFDDIYDLKADIIKGQKSKSILKSHVNQLCKRKLPADVDLQSIARNRLKYLKAGLTVYKQQNKFADQVITRMIFSDAEKLAQEITCRAIEYVDKLARKNDFIQRYNKLCELYKEAHFDGKHKIYANFSLDLIKNLLANYNDDAL